MLHSAAPQDVEPEVMEELLRYIYTNKVNSINAIAKVRTSTTGIQLSGVLQGEIYFWSFL